MRVITRHAGRPWALSGWRHWSDRGSLGAHHKTGAIGPTEAGEPNERSLWLADLNRFVCRSRAAWADANCPPCCSAFRAPRARRGRHFSLGCPLARQLTRDRDTRCGQHRCLSSLHVTSALNESAEQPYFASWPPAKLTPPVPIRSRRHQTLALSRYHSEALSSPGSLLLQLLRAVEQARPGRWWAVCRFRAAGGIGRSKSHYWKLCLPCWSPARRDAA